MIYKIKFEVPKNQLEICSLNYTHFTLFMLFKQSEFISFTGTRKPTITQG